LKNYNAYIVIPSLEKVKGFLNIFSEKMQIFENTSVLLK